MEMEYEIHDYLKYASQEIINKYVEEVGLEQNKMISSISLEGASQEIIDKFVKEKLKHEGIDRTFTWKFLDLASQDIIDQAVKNYIDERIEDNINIRPEIIALGSDKIIKYYLKIRRKQGVGVEVSDEIIESATQDTIDEHIKELMKVNEKIDEELIKRASQETVNKYVKKVVDEGKFLLEPEVLKLASQEVIDWYTKNIVREILNDDIPYDVIVDNYDIFASTFHLLSDQKLIDSYAKQLLDKFGDLPDDILDVTSLGTSKNYSDNNQKQESYNRGGRVVLKESMDIGDQYEFLSHASQEVVDKAIEKFTKKGDAVDEQVLEMGSQEVVDKYVRHFIKKDDVELYELNLASQEVVDEHIKDYTNEKLSIGLDILELGSQGVVDEHIQMMIRDGIIDNLKTDLQRGSADPKEVDQLKDLASDKVEKELEDALDDDEEEFEEGYIGNSLDESYKRHEYIEKASQSVIDTYVRKIGSNPRIRPIEEHILKMASQEAIDDYVINRGKDGIALESFEMHEASDEAIDQYVRGMGDNNVLIGGEILRHVPSQGTVDDYIKKQADNGALIFPEIKFYASQDAIDDYVRTMGDKGISINPTLIHAASDDVSDHYWNAVNKKNESVVERGTLREMIMRKAFS